MSRLVHGSAPGVAVGSGGGVRTVLHRYEIVGEVLVRRRFADRRPFADGETRLVDVLLDEDETGRTLRVVRGIALRERDLPRADRPGWPVAWREFDVGSDLVLAIAQDLRVGLRGPARVDGPLGGRRPAERVPFLRLATLDGRPVG